MKKSIKLALRASEIRSDINKLDPGDDHTGEAARAARPARYGRGRNTAPRSPKRVRPSRPAPRTRTASLPKSAPFVHLEHPRGAAAWPSSSVMDGKPLTGAAKELQEHRGLSGHDLPWDLIAPRPAPRTDDRAEHRVDAVSAAPADSHLQQHTILGRVFARSATAALGVSMPMVATGEQNFPVVTTTDAAVILAKDAAEGDAADAGITAHTISPTRLAAKSYVFRREDQAVLSGLEEALRADLSTAVSDLLDRQVLAGDGTTGAELGGFLATAANGGIANRSDTPARVDLRPGCCRRVGPGHRRQVCRLALS